MSSGHHHKLVLALGLSLSLIGSPVGPLHAGETDGHRSHSLIHRPSTTSDSSSTPVGSTTAAMQQPENSPPTPAPVERKATPPTGNHRRKLTKRPAVAVPAPPAGATSIPNSTPQRAATSVPVLPKTVAANESTSTLKPSTGAADGTQTRVGASVVGTTSAPPFVPFASTYAASAAGSTLATAAATAPTTPGPSSFGSRSPQALLQRPEIAALLQPSVPTVTTQPSSPPSTSPPSPSPATTGSATLAWNQNNDADLAGYKVYVGTQSGVYNYPGSPFTVGTTTSYTVTNLPKGQTYYFALSAYDTSGNESPLSAEASKSIF